MSKTKEIKEVVDRLGFKNQEMFTLGELEKIASNANVRVIDVMMYLRSRHR